MEHRGEEEGAGVTWGVCVRAKTIRTRKGTNPNYAGVRVAAHDRDNVGNTTEHTIALMLLRRRFDRIRLDSIPLYHTTTVSKNIRPTNANNTRARVR